MSKKFILPVGVIALFLLAGAGCNKVKITETTPAQQPTQEVGQKETTPTPPPTPKQEKEPAAQGSVETRPPLDQPPGIKPQKCFVQDCHSSALNPTCAPDSPGPCTLDIQATDICGKYVSCDNSCNLVKQNKHDQCVNCFKDCAYRANGECRPTQECLNQFPEYDPNIWGYPSN